MQRNHCPVQSESKTLQLRRRRSDRLYSNLGVCANCGSHKRNLNDINTDYLIEKIIEEMLSPTSSLTLKQSYANTSFYDNKIFDDIMHNF